MSIDRKSPTSWEMVYPVGLRNASHNIEATQDGLEIDYELLTWEDIDAARAALGQPVKEGE